MHKKHAIRWNVWKFFMALLVHFFVANYFCVERKVSVITGRATSSENKIRTGPTIIWIFTCHNNLFHQCAKKHDVDGSDDGYK